MADVNSADTTIQTLKAMGGYALVDTAKYGEQFINPGTESIFEIGMSENNLEGGFNHIGMGFITGAYVQGFGFSPRFWVPENYITSHFQVERTGYGVGWVWYKNNWHLLELKVVGSRYYIMDGGIEVDVTSSVDGGNTGGYAYVYYPEIDDYESELVGGLVPDAGEVRYRNNFTKVGTQGYNLIKYSNVVYRNPSNKTQPVISNNLPVFRLSDMNLLQAEIAIYKGNLPQAIDIINGYRTRNNASATSYVPANASKATVLQEYILERGKELYMEGHIYFDLLRTRQYGQMISWMSIGRFQAEGFYWPVYPLLFNDNKFLTQTSYWRGKV